ncbi:MAG: pitrilysin family protein [Xanthomonadales bacterium]|nr:pitrilysin family protein [Xanthomonadales bacterium]
MVQKTLLLLTTMLLAACASTGTRPGGDDLPQHPSELTFGERTISFPDAADYRHELAGGNIAYIVEDRSLPLIQLSMSTRAGSYLLGPEQTGLGSMTATMLRDGGTRDLTPDDLDERLAFLATGISFSIGQTRSSASINTLSSNFDESLGLMFDMITEPRLDAERLQINVERSVEAMRRRNDDTRGIEPRVWSDLMLGEGFFANRRPTKAQVEAIDTDAMRAFGQRVFSSGGLVFALSGDIDTEVAVAALNQQLSRLARGEALPPVPESTRPSAPGVYGVDKDDVTQTRVSVGHPGPRIRHPDEFAISVMNEVLGGGGFTSRITSRVRSDEGLAYSAGSRFSLGRHYPGQFRVFYQSKNESVSQALAIVMEEIERIRTEPVTEQELRVAIEGRVAYLAELYSSAAAKAGRFASDHLNEEDPDFWRQYEANVRKVTRDDVLRAARTHLKPEDLRILLVGKLEEAQAGDGTHGTVQEITGQQLTRLPLKDPLTLEPLE